MTNGYSTIEIGPDGEIAKVIDEKGEEVPETPGNPPPDDIFTNVIGISNVARCVYPISGGCYCKSEMQMPEYFIMHIDEQGQIVKITDKETGEEIPRQSAGASPDTQFVNVINISARRCRYPKGGGCYC